jgi:hypothetical protein
VAAQSRTAKKGRMFFFEKKNQKTFITRRTFAGEARDSRPKVFCFFFSKKKTFLSCAQPTAA